VLLLGIGRDRAASPTDAATSDASETADALVVLPISDASDVDGQIVDASDDERDAGRGKKRDAGAPIDASARPIDAAAARPVDAAVAATPIDAAVTGTGFLTCTADPYALVTVDGEDYGSTPFFKRAIAAGKHEVVFTKPVGGAVVKRRVVEILPGKTVTVTAP